MSALWPRIEQSVAEGLLAEHRARTEEHLYRAHAFSHPSATFASTGGVRVTEEKLSQFRDVIVDTARAHGFPDRTDEPIAFDRAMAVRLPELMPMAEGEALVRQVWSFLSLVLAPDVTHWRFVRNRSGPWNPERWVCTDRTRHMFSRLWWQAHQLVVVTEEGPDASLLNGLSESELNHLTERTSIGGCGPLVRALARAVVALPDDQRARDVVRQGALIVLRRLGVVDPYSLTEAQLDELATDAIFEAIGSPVLHLPSGRPESTEPPDRGAAGPERSERPG